MPIRRVFLRLTDGFETAKRCRSPILETPLDPELTESAVEYR